MIQFLFLGSNCYFLIGYTIKVYKMDIKPLKLCFCDQGIGILKCKYLIEDMSEFVVFWSHRFIFCFYLTLN